jgi:TPR repeat protein
VALPFYKKTMPLNRHRHWLITACLLILSLLPAGAKAEFSPEEIKTFQEQKLAAETGDSSAQLQLGHCYHNGWGVAKNEAEAEKWYKMSAEQGNLTAKFYLKTLRETVKAEESETPAKGQSGIQGRNKLSDAVRDLVSRNEYKPRPDNHDLNSALRTKPARIVAGWIIIIALVISLIIIVSSVNFFGRLKLGESLEDDLRFTSRFKPHTRQYPKYGMSILWIITGFAVIIAGLLLFINLKGAGAAFGVFLMIGGAYVLAYNSDQSTAKQSESPEDRLLEVKFQKDRVCLRYSITGQRELVFGTDLRIWIGSREKYQGGITLFNETYARVLRGLGIYATFKDALGKVELELDFPGTAEFIAHCRHHGAEINLGISLDERIASRLAATPSWQPGWQPCEADQGSETDKAPTYPKLWNPTATAIWSFFFCAALGSWLQAANWRELGNPEKARRSMVWFYGLIVFPIAYVFILPYFLLTPELLDYTWGLLTTVVWYCFSGKEQIRYVRESQLSYAKKGWTKPVLTFCAIFAAWLGLCFGSDEFFQATLRANAFRGDASAQRVLAWKHANGKDVTEDQEEASRLFRKAAEQGDQYAQAALGFRLQEGEGTPKNDLEAFKWFRLSADQGNDVAQNMLGVCCFYGLGTEKNYEEAAKWYRKSAENGNAEAQNQLGRCYFNGHGVKKNMAESLKWHRMAADQGDAEAQYIVGLKHAAGSGTDKNPAEALKWYLRSANQDYADAQHKLGESYAEGTGATKDISEAIKWYKKAAERGNLTDQINLGDRYFGGLGVTRDKHEAVKWYLKAAEQGSAYAQVKVGLAYEGGDGVDMNQFEAVKWFRKAAEQGDMFGQLGLGIHLVAGHGVNQDQAAGLAMIRKSADLGNAYAYMTLGDYHATGKAGLTKDLVEAYAHLSLAGFKLEKARNELADLEKKMDAQSISNGKKRALELKKEIDAKRAAPQPAK